MNSRPEIDELIEGQVEKLAFGGEGILRHQNFVIFVPFTAPGDKITCRIVEVKKSFAKAELVEVQTPGPHRVQPRCPYFGTCGGCQLQHINDEEQSKYKLDSVYEALERIGHLHAQRMDLAPVNLKWAYRRHVTLHLRAFGECFEAGYIAVDNHSLVVIQTCPIFNTPDDPIMHEIQGLVHRLPNPDHLEGRLTVLKTHQERYILYFQLPQTFKVEPAFFNHALQHVPAFAGILVTTPKKQAIFGDIYSEQKFENLIFRFTPQTFIQNHPEQSANIYQQICSLTATHPPKNILDLYCGFGITSLLLAKQGHHVLGMEYNPEAIKFAQENARANHLHLIQFQQGDVEKLLPKLGQSFKSDLIVLNPPRTGLTKGVIKELLKIQAAELIYVSCMPATLARDLALLVEKDYKIEKCQVYDMFPQTAHVETLVHLVRKKSTFSFPYPKNK